MPYLKLEQAYLAFGHVPLLDAADFQLDPGERVALIGRNGTGKSSLLAALAGQAHLDDGLVWSQPGIRVAYVPQEPPYDPSMTVFEAVVAGMGETSKLLAEYHAVSHHLADTSLASAQHEALLARLNELQHTLEAIGAWTQQTQAEKAIAQFGLDPDKTIATLSGGQKKRLALAQALAIAPDVLLLDEPTKQQGHAGFNQQAF